MVIRQIRQSFPPPKFPLYSMHNAYDQIEFIM